MSLFGRDIVGSVGMFYHSVTLFDLSVVTVLFKILSGPYLGNCKVYDVDIW